MSTNPLKQKLRAGQACFGVWMLSTSADMAEILGYAGLDFLVLDHEHGRGSIDDAIGSLKALFGGGATLHGLGVRTTLADARSG